MRFLHYSLLPVLLGAALLARPAAAQTARIAHLSHSGSAATLDATADNFGIPPSHFVADSIEILSDSTAREYGKWTGYHPSVEKTKTIQFTSRTYNPIHQKTAQAYLANRQKYQPQIKVIKRDTTLAVPAPSLKKPKARRKNSALLPLIPTPPQHAGVALTVAAILVLTGAGWLLGERKARPQPAA